MRTHKGQKGLYRGSRGGVGAPPDDVVSIALKKTVGATITDAGFLDGSREGGLTLDYDKDGVEMRLVLGYNDLGEWVEWQGPLEDFKTNDT